MIIRYKTENLFDVFECRQNEFKIIIKDGFKCGPTTLSLKFKKRRKLVRGHVRSMPNSTPQGLFWDYFFRPNDPRKLREIMSRT